MEVIPNANPDLVLMQANGGVKESGEFEFWLGPEIPIVGFKQQTAIGVIDVWSTTTLDRGLAVANPMFIELVVKNKATGAFFSQPHEDKDDPWLWAGDWEIWEDEEHLRQAAERASHSLMARGIQKQAGHDLGGYFDCQHDATKIIGLHANLKSDCEFSALCWLCGCEQDIAHSPHFEEADPRDVLDYIREAGFKAVPPRLLAAVEQKAA